MHFHKYVFDGRVFEEYSDSGFYVIVVYDTYKCTKCGKLKYTEIVKTQSILSSYIDIIVDRYIKIGYKRHRV